MSAFSSRINPSFFSGTNENNLSLANLKFDFSLLKFEAPSEFGPLGSALSRRRRNEAENGPQHKTAQRLAALFEQIVPSTPKLISAYGSRVSEIIDTPGINPVGSTSDGAFEEFVGADGTAIWAAATSRTPALGVYLLACLLARLWGAKEATSIWVELVAERKREIKEAFEANHPVTELGLVGAQQDISRSDIQHWDASARSWLRSADQAKQWEHDQLLLIVKNIDAPFMGGSSTYEKVISTWKQGMKAIEELLCGRPQEIYTASVLLALSSWHMYPDLIVLRNKTVKVKLKDRLLPDTGICTIGLQAIKPQNSDGVRWSLALSHLQYYGDPVTVTTTADYSRVTISQLRLVAFGGMLGNWRVNSRDFEAAAMLFCQISTILEKASKTDKIWLKPLARAASSLVSSDSASKQDKLKLIKYGHRRAKNFLQDADDSFQPYFGLCNPHVLSGFSQDSDAEYGITYLRSIASSLGLKSADCIILYSHQRSPYESPSYYEYATAVPYEGLSKKRDSEGRRVHERVHARWYHISDASMEIGNGQDIEKGLKLRMSQIGEFEQCSISKQPPKPVDPRTPQGSFSPLLWENPPRVFHPPDSPEFTSASLSSSKYYEQPSSENLAENVTPFSCYFYPLHGTWSCGLFIKSTDGHNDMTFSYKVKLKTALADNIGPSAALKRISQSSISKTTVSSYLLSVTPGGRPRSLDQSALLLASERHVISGDCLKSFYALYYASLIYNGLDGATISLQIISKRLGNANWVKGISRLPTRDHAFACITYLDSGTVDLLPEDMEFALAVCIQNSIFVAAVVISDPLETIKAYDIRRLVGNIGKPGICVLVAPQNPQIRRLQDDYSVVNHAPYDYKREDNFKDTSLHLSFTDWSMPLDTGGIRTIDKEVNIIESIITIRDRGVFVADLDILSIQHGNLVNLSTDQKCPGSHDDNEEYDYTSIDNWEELLDAPVSVGIFRAHGNWVARLAAASILSRRGLDYCTGIFDKKKFCLKCLESQYQVSAHDLDKSETHMPSICID
ncbi:hypothetical protein FQN54_001777 [Arachnomyces sp. PD_36]|nr:hypothetical protein FQN54_001777 [Arachnomyces sp. PD_36]